jgi:alpha-tubulin suppressor-like RCC1 family protein
LCVRDTPVLVATIEGVIDFDMGAKHTLAVTRDGAVYSWGNNSMNQLGRDGPGNWPAMATIDGSDCIILCAAGDSHSACLTEEGELYTWGSNDDYACGRVSSVTKVYMPQKLDGLPKLVSVSAGTKHVVGVDENNCIWGFGSNEHGQLKPNEQNVLDRPTMLT